MDRDTDSMTGCADPVKGADTGDNSPGTPKRQQWTSQLDYIMASIGCCVGLGNIWRFPYLCYKNGGGAFLIPYAISFFFVAVPLFVFETTLGQYTTGGAVKAWGILPMFQGLGFAAVMLLVYQNIYYVIVIAWSLYYIGVSFTSRLPWATCDNPWNTPRCFVSGMNLSNPCTSENNYSLPMNGTEYYNAVISSTGNHSRVHNLTSSYGNVTDVLSDMLQTNCTAQGEVITGNRVDSVEEFWERRALDMSPGIDQPGRLNPGMTLAFAVAWLIVYICLCRGVRVTGKIVYVTALLPYLLLLVLLVRTLTFDGSLNGIVYYLKPNLTRMADPKVWVEGGTQVIYSCGLGQGFLIAMGSFNKFHSDGVRNSLIITTANSLTSIYGGLVVFAVLGFMAHEMDVPVDKVVTSGPGLIFLAYPKAVTNMPLAPFWSVLFFLTIFFVGIDSQFVVVEGIITPLFDRFPKIFNRVRNRMIYLAFHCIVAFLVGLCQVTQGGVYVFRLFDYYSSSGVVLLILCLCESIAVGWVFGADRYYDVLQLMTGRRCSPWFKICWKYCAPVILTGILVFEISSFQTLKFSPTYQYPVWATTVGGLFVLSSCIFLPAVFIYKCARTSGTFRQRWRHVTTPVLRKHMVDPRWKGSNYVWSLKDNGSNDSLDNQETDFC
uniref:Transporter n=1 Tax=Sinonovacula rivularis TaxID=489091 RepID=A0AA49X8H4_9BIVA|nr:NTT11 [Sinonovacula rivularis]